MKKFNFSLKVTLTCLILSGLMIKAAFWQYNRYIEKQKLIKTLNQRLSSPVLDLKKILFQVEKNPYEFVHRKISTKGEFDFKNEITLKNRRHNDIPGNFLITPLKIEGTDKYVLVSRGFIPKKLLEAKQQFQKEKNIEFVGLAKSSMEPKFFLSPRDDNSVKLRDWLRINIKEIEKQLNYKLLPIYLEVMTISNTNEETINQIIKSDSDKSDMLFLPLRGLKNHEKEKYPALVYDTHIPPGRHYAYIYEWSIMAIMTILIGIILQFKRS